MSRKLRTTLLIAAATTAMAGAWLGADAWRTNKELGYIAAAEAWARIVEASLAANPATRKVTVSVPTRHYAFGPPTWSVVVHGYVLDDNAEAAARAIVAAAPPLPVGRTPRWSLHSCLGDRDLYERAGTTPNPP